jgi:hypothetical protein
MIAGFGAGFSDCVPVPENAAILATRRLLAQPFAYPGRMTGKDQQKDSRKRRLSAALRDNLKRRRAQAKERAAGCAAAEPGRAGTHDSAGIDGDKQKRSP